MKMNLKLLMRTSLVTAALFTAPMAAQADDNREACHAAREACVASTGVTFTRPEPGQEFTDAQKADMAKVHACMEAKNLKCGPPHGGGRGGHHKHDGQRPPKPPADASVGQ